MITYKIIFTGRCPAKEPDHQCNDHCNVIDQLCPGLGEKGCPAVRAKKLTRRELLEEIRAYERMICIYTYCAGEFIPSCRKHFAGNQFHKYCPYCGRKVKVVK